MHGLIINQFFSLIKKNYSEETLKDIKHHAHLKGQYFDTMEMYPDEDFKTLLHSGSIITNTPESALLTDLGEFVIPTMLDIYGSYLNKEWDCMDLIEHSESTMHRVVRTDIKDSSPPFLEVNRISKTKIILEYTSERQLIEFGIGIIKGIATFYNSTINVIRVDTTNGTTLTVEKIA